MATLTGNAINTSYQGLIKFDDNGAVDPTTLKQLTDGTGGSLPIQVSQIETKFQSLVDFTGATVSGLPTAAAGLEVGTGTNSLVNAVGGASTASGVNSIAIGNACNTNQEAGIALGDRASATGYGSFAAGLFAQASGFGGFALGQYAESSNGYGAAFGPSSKSIAESAIAFGQATEANHTGAIAMGRFIQTVNADTTHVRALYIVAPDGGTGGNGITMLSPDGTAGVITLTNASELAIDGTPIGGGGGAAGLVASTGEDSMKSADSLTTLPAYSLAPRGIAIGNNARVDSTFAQDGIAMGNNARVLQAQGIAIGENTESYGNGVSIGASAKSTSSVGQQVAIGLQSKAGWGGVALGTSAEAQAKWSAAVGYDAIANVAEGSIALGSGVVAETAYTATVNLFQIAAYATMNYATDAAAATGGIPLGGVYHTDGALKIRIA
jgi:trimeric autotransporter adhesin